MRDVLLGMTAWVCIAATAQGALISHYALDGNGIDSVGGRNLIFSGVTSFSSNVPPGFAGQSLALNGTGFGKYDVTGADSLSGAFTVAAWVNMSPGFGSFLNGIVGTRSPADNSFDMKVQSINIHGDIGNGTNWIATSADASVALAAGTWYHIAYVVTQTGYTVYVDGVQKGSGSYAASTPLLFNASHDLFVGGTGFVGAELFHGLIDDVRIYDTALAPSEVQALMVPPVSAVPLPAALGAGLLMGAAVLLRAGRRKCGAAG